MTNVRKNLSPNRPRPADPDSVPDPDGSIDIETDASNRPLPMTDDNPDVGLSQKGTGEEAVIRRETEI